MDSLNGLYRAKVIDRNDPLGRNRLRVQIAQLTGLTSISWATPGDPTIYTMPDVGSFVMVTFESGDSGKPFWWGGNGETAIPGQMTALQAYADNSAGAAATGSTTSSQKYAHDFTVNSVLQGRVYLKDNLPVTAGGFWSAIPWTTNFDYPNIFGAGVDNLVRRLNDGTRLNAPVNGQYLYSMTMAFAPMSAGTVYAARAVWNQDQSPYNHVVAQSGPYVATLQAQPILTLCFTTDQDAATNIRFQITSSANSTLYRDDYPVYGVSTRTRVDVTLIKRFDI